MTTTNVAEFTVTFNEEERAELLRLLEASLVEVHVEKRRTEAPGYQQQVLRQENLLRALIFPV